MRFEERLPVLGVDQEGPEELEVCQVREGGGEYVECGVVDLTAEVQPEMREVGIQMDESAKCWRIEFWGEGG